LYSYLLSSWIDYIKSINNILYTEGTSKLGYIKNTSKGIYIESAYNRMYTRNKNKVIYIEFASYRYLVLLITENRLVYILSKISTG
jgi:hypothetical protein